MISSKLLAPATFQTNRSQLRQNQSSVLRKARGSAVVIVKAGATSEDEKCVLDKKYFDELLEKFRATLETIEIAADQRLFSRLLKASETIDEDMRRGKLHSFEEAFGEE